MYFRNVRRLHRLTDETNAIPTSAGWLSKEELMTKFKKLPLTQRRTLSVAAVKAGQVYGKNNEKWVSQMYKSQSEYTDQRDKNEKTDKEKKLWPKGGFASIKKAATEQKRRIRHVLTGEPSNEGVFRYGMYIVLRLFSELPFRNTFADLQVSKSAEGNYIDVPKRGNIKLYLRQFKHSKQIGHRDFTLSKANSTALRKYLKYREAAGVTHKFLLSTKSGARMTRGTLGISLHKLTKDLLGKSFGSRLIRILASSSVKPEIDKAVEMSEKLLHGRMKQTKQYTRK